MSTNITDVMSTHVAGSGEAPAESPSTIGNESPASLSNSGFCRLWWDLSIAIDLSSGEVATVPSDATETLVVQAGTMIAVQGKSDRGAYVYLAVISDLDRIVHVYPDNDEAIWVEDGVTTRVPPQGWYTVPADGKVRVISALRPLSREEIAQGLGGRRGKTQVSTNSTKKPPSTPANCSQLTTPMDDLRIP